MSSRDRQRDHREVPAHDDRADRGQSQRRADVVRPRHGHVEADCDRERRGFQRKDHPEPVRREQRRRDRPRLDDRAVPQPDPGREEVAADEERHRRGPHRRPTSVEIASQLVEADDRRPDSRGAVRHRSLIHPTIGPCTYQAYQLSKGSMASLPGRHETAAIRQEKVEKVYVSYGPARDPLASRFHRLAAQRFGRFRGSVLGTAQPSLRSASTIADRALQPVSRVLPGGLRPPGGLPPNAKADKLYKMQHRQGTHAAFPPVCTSAWASDY